MDETSNLLVGECTDATLYFSWLCVRVLERRCGILSNRANVILLVLCWDEAGRDLRGTLAECSLQLSRYDVYLEIHSVKITSNSTLALTALFYSP